MKSKIFSRDKSQAVREETASCNGADVITPKMYEALKSALEGVRCAPSPALPIQMLASQVCPACGSDQFGILRYPAFRSRFFSGLILATCRACGQSWVPKDDLDLDYYYSKLYAREFRSERRKHIPFYDPNNPVWKQPKHAVRDRAARLNAFLKSRGPFDSVLDIGAGEGFFLSGMTARQKFADEPDEDSRRILQEELNVCIRPLADFKRELSLVVALHVLEHFTYCNLRDKIAQIASALKPGGLFLCEVPSGATQIHSFENGKRTFFGQFEPHTLFFSSKSLILFLREANFEILEASRCGWAKKNLSPSELEEVFGQSECYKFPSEEAYAKPIVVLARVPGERLCKDN